MKHCITAIAATLLLACGESSPHATNNGSHQDGSDSPQHYFPVMDFLKGEIAAVDSLPVGIMQYRTVGNKRDSGYISLPAFHALVDEFTTLGEKEFKTSYSESSFFDASHQSGTFLYSGTGKQSIRRIDVVTQQSDTYDKVKSLYIEKVDDYADSTVTKKLHWKPARNFQLIKQVDRGESDPEVETIKVVWDNRD